MTKKNIYLILGVSVAIFVLLIGFLYFYNKIANVAVNPPPTNSTPKQNAGTTTAGQSNQPSITSGNAAIASGSSTPLDLALRLNDPDQCLNAKKDQPYIDGCLTEVAIKAGDANSCSKIGNSVQAQYCSDMILFNKAVNDNKISECSNISSNSLNESCVNRIVALMPGIKATDCGTLPDREKPYCFQWVSYFADSLILKNSQSAADCQSITLAGIKAECLIKFKQ